MSICLYVCVSMSVYLYLHMSVYVSILVHIFPLILFPGSLSSLLSVHPSTCLPIPIYLVHFRLSAHPTPLTSLAHLSTNPLTLLSTNPLTPTHLSAYSRLSVRLSINPSNPSNTSVS